MPFYGLDLISRLAIGPTIQRRSNTALKLLRIKIAQNGTTYLERHSTTQLSSFRHFTAFLSISGVHTGYTHLNHKYHTCIWPIQYIRIPRVGSVHLARVAVLGASRQLAYSKWSWKGKSSTIVHVQRVHVTLGTNCHQIAELGNNLRHI